MTETNYTEIQVGVLKLNDLRVATMSLNPCQTKSDVSKFSYQDIRNIINNARQAEQVMVGCLVGEAISSKN